MLLGYWLVFTGVGVYVCLGVGCFEELGLFEWVFLLLGDDGCKLTGA